MRERIARAAAFVRGEGVGPLLLRSIAGGGAVQLGGMLVAFLVGVQLARGLGVTGYGYYGIAMAVITLATIPGTLGVPKLVTRDIAAADARDDVKAEVGVVRWADSVSMRISLAISVAVAVGAGIAWKASSGAIGRAIFFGAPMIALLPLAAIRSGALRGLHRVVLAQLPTGFLRPLAMSILLFAVFSSGLHIGVSAAMALNSVTAAGALVLADRWLASRLPCDVPAGLMPNKGEWLASSIPLALTDAVFALQLQLSVLVLGIVVAPAEVGLFRVSTAAAIVVAVPMTIVNMTAMSTFSRLHAQGDRSQLRRVITQSARIQFLFVLCLALPVVLGAGPLLELAFGRAYVPAADTLRILAIGEILNAATGPNGTLLNMTGHERRVTRAVSIGVVVNVALVLLLSRTYGSQGAAFGLVASQICWNALLWRDAKKRLDLDTSILGLNLRG